MNCSFNVCFRASLHKSIALHIHANRESRRSSGWCNLDFGSTIRKLADGIKMIITSFNSNISSHSISQEFGWVIVQFSVNNYLFNSNISSHSISQEFGWVIVQFSVNWYPFFKFVYHL
jgi:hypothetical protein